MLAPRAALVAVAAVSATAVSATGTDAPAREMSPVLLDAVLQALDNLCSVIPESFYDIPDFQNTQPFRYCFERKRNGGDDIARSVLKKIMAETEGLQQKEGEPASSSPLALDPQAEIVAKFEELQSSLHFQATAGEPDAGLSSQPLDDHSASLVIADPPVQPGDEVDDDTESPDLPPEEPPASGREPDSQPHPDSATAEEVDDGKPEDTNNDKSEDSNDVKPEDVSPEDINNIKSPNVNDPENAATLLVPAFANFAAVVMAILAAALF